MTCGLLPSPSVNRESDAYHRRGKGLTKHLVKIDERSTSFCPVYFDHFVVKVPLYHPVVNHVNLQAECAVKLSQLEDPDV